MSAETNNMMLGGNTTLGWIEITRPLLGSQIAFELSLGQSVQKYKIAKKMKVHQKRKYSASPRFNVKHI